MGNPRYKGSPQASGVSREDRQRVERILTTSRIQGNQDLNTSSVCMDTSNSSRDTTPEPSDNEESSNEEEHFQTVPMDDEHWTTEMAPERTFCIHENGLPNNVCSYACPYGYNGTPSYIDSLDLSDISDLEDNFLTTSNDEDLPGLEEVPY